MIAHRSTNRAMQMALLAWTVLQIAAPSASAQSSPQGFAISREVDFVVLPVTVINRSGQFVSGLEESNFRVYENGRLQTISLFRSEDTPVAVGLVVDRSGSMAARSNDVIEGATAFVEASNPQDEEFVINFAEKARLGLPANAPFTSDINQLKAALLTASGSGQTALYDAVTMGLLQVNRSQAGKKVLILISDGGDNASQHNFEQVLRLAQNANVVVYTIGLYDTHSADQNPKVLRQLASETGGLTYSPDTFKEVVRVCRQIAEDIRHQYTIGYDPLDENRNTYRKIRVAVASAGRAKLTVRTREGYLPGPSKPGNSQARPSANR